MLSATTEAVQNCTISKRTGRGKQPKGNAPGAFFLELARDWGYFRRKLETWSRRDTAKWSWPLVEFPCLNLELAPAAVIHNRQCTGERDRTFIPIQTLMWTWSQPHLARILVHTHIFFSCEEINVYIDRTSVLESIFLSKKNCMRSGM